MAPSLVLLMLVVGATPRAPARLPVEVRPLRYQIDFTIEPDKATFSGIESISLRLASPTQQILLHAVGLKVSDAAFWIEGEHGQLGASVNTAVQSVPEDEMIALKPERPLPAGGATVRFTFSGRLPNELRGLYLARTKEGLAEAFTQFEASDARRAFPCFDEPTFKAVFGISVTAPQGLSAVSNGAQTTDVPAAPGLHRVSFADTPMISSYLVALAVGKFEVLGGKAGATPVRVITPPGQGLLGHYALAMTERVVPWFERYFGIPFPYPKLDLVGVPEFAAGGMENAGAIFFRDSALLLDEGHASVAQQQRVAAVVAHEIAHQWFGDLVTMVWWDDVWLNESFATFMGDLSLAALEPEWPIMESSAAAIQRAMATDALPVAHPVHDSPESGPGTAQFSELIYSKGEAVLRMLAHYSGEETFRQGIHEYLTTHALGNAREDDLWDALGKVSHQDVAAVAHSWLNQPGLPLLTVLDRSVRQERFSPLGGNAESWQIPVCTRSAQGAGCKLLTAPVGPLPQHEVKGGPLPAELEPDLRPGPLVADSFNNPLGNIGKFLDANAGAFGYYRVSYRPKDLSALRKALRNGKLSGPERLGLLADEWWLMRAGQAELRAPLQIITDLRDEPSSAVTGQMLAVLLDLNQLLEPKDRPPFQKMVARLLGPHCRALGWQPKPSEWPDRRELRAALLNAMDLLAADPATAAEGERRLAAWEADPRSLDASLLPTVLAIGARHGDAARWDDYRARIGTAPTPEVRLRLEQALGQFRDPILLERTLELTLPPTASSADAFPAQDIGLLFVSLFSNPAARSQTWTFLASHWPELTPRIVDYFLERQVLPGVGQLCSATERQQVVELFKAHPLKSGDRMVQRVLENIDLCLKVRAAQAPKAPAAVKAMSAALGSKT